MYLLDTDHVSLDQRGDPRVTAKIRSAGPEQVTISIITVEEQFRGWLALINSAKSGEQRSAAYRHLRAALVYFASTMLLDYDLPADRKFEELRRQGIRIGTKDLRIAAIALTQNAIVVTRNSRDFGMIPNLEIVDWSRSE